MSETDLGLGSSDLGDSEQFRSSSSIPTTAPPPSGGEPFTREHQALLADSKAFLAGGKLPTRKAMGLERALAKQGEHVLAAQVRRAHQKVELARAREVVAGAPADIEELSDLGKSLERHREFGWARRVLTLACERITRNTDPKIFKEVFQAAALCTYKDPDLPLDWKLDRAYAILSKPENLAETTDTETLGLAGAIFKRKWEVDGQRQNLERSLFYYLKGYSQSAPLAQRADVLEYLAKHPSSVFDATQDRGYNGINAAFVLDLLAAQEQAEAGRVGFTAQVATKRREQASAIRAELTRSVPRLLEQPAFEWLRDAWWFYATVGEAYFGLGEYRAALEWLVDRPAAAGLVVGNVHEPSGLHVPQWEYESTARQLSQLARLRFETDSHPAASRGEVTEEDFARTPQGETLEKFLKGDTEALLSAFRGKFGLGLSGGGFRASLYHIGVLARLAEIDALRHVEVLSCVSGGSIVGAHYYLEVRRLLQTKTDAQITREDYIEIVKRLETQFLFGVQSNIRTRVLAEFTTNLKMIFSKRYSRTLRVGELYERELYSKVADGWGSAPRLLRDLCIFPLGPNGQRQTDFKPQRDNWSRKNKAPVLVLNACSLNTGHNWQFTATYMGEPPAPIQSDIDCNYRLRRFYYNEQPPKTAPITLGQAVAASSCVPGLFEPIVLDGYYPFEGERPISVRLVDGGVCDNQGVASLLEQDCSVVLISDGSGQMDAVDVPSGGAIGVALRSNSILQARVRETQYADVVSRRRSNLLRGLMFVHLKQGLPGKALAWRECPAEEQQSDVYQANYDNLGAQTGMTNYLVSHDTQSKLAAIRTDLDSFSNAEAYALMASGYRMTAVQFRGPTPCIGGFTDAAPVKWAFNAIDPALTGGVEEERLRRVLDAGSRTAFKIWSLSPGLVVVKWALLIALVATLLVLVFTRWASPLIAVNLTFGAVATALLLMAVAPLAAWAFGSIGKNVVRTVRWQDTLRDVAIGVAMSTLGFIIARIHLHLFDPWFLRAGEVRRILSK